MGKRKLRIGHIDYLNALPVLFPLEIGLLSDDFELVKGVPAEINERFRRGELDISMVSSVEYARASDDWLLLPNLSIAADGRVLSVLLFSTCQPADLGGRPVALTNASATSVALARTLFRRHWCVEPVFTVQRPDLEAMLAAADACLLIGDDALRAVTALQRAGGKIRGRRLFVTDIGEVWQQHRGLPMVYGLWVVRRDVAASASAQVAAFLRACAEAKRFSRAYRPHLVELGAASRRLDPALVAKYFAVISHDLDDRQQQGLLAFYEEAALAGEVAAVPSLQLFAANEPPAAATVEGYR